MAMLLLSLRIERLARYVLGSASENSEDSVIKELEFELQEPSFWLEKEINVKKLEEAANLLTPRIENLERECLIVADGALMDRVAGVEIKVVGAATEVSEEVPLITRVKRLEDEIG